VRSYREEVQLLEAFLALESSREQKSLLSNLLSSSFNLFEIVFSHWLSRTFHQ